MKNSILYSFMAFYLFISSCNNSHEKKIEAKTKDAKHKNITVDSLKPSKSKQKKIDFFIKTFNIDSEFIKTKLGSDYIILKINTDKAPDTKYLSLCFTKELSNIKFSKEKIKETLVSFRYLDKVKILLREWEFDNEANYETIKKLIDLSIYQDEDGDLCEGFKEPLYYFYNIKTRSIVLISTTSQGYINHLDDTVNRLGWNKTP